MASRIIIRADDTDVLVLLLFYSAKGCLAPEVYMHAAHTGKIITRKLFIPVHTIAAKLGERFCLCLPALHSLTGCDTTSAIYKLGKRTAYKTLQENEEKSKALSTLSEMSIREAVEISRTLLLLMYRKKDRGCKTLDELRYKLFSDLAANMLPRTEDSFCYHVMHCLYQTKLWCNSHIAKPTLPDSDGHGWHKLPAGWNP